MPDRPPENPAQPEHIRRSGTASSIFQPKAMPSKSGRSVRRPSLRRREGCRRPRPKRTAYHPPEARREAPCPPPHSRPAAKKRRTEEVVGSAEASYIPAGGRTAHSSGHRIGGRSPAGARPPRGRETSAPTSDPEYRLRDDTRRPTGRVLHNPEISPFLYSGIGFVPFRSRRGAASERSYLRKRLSRERVPVRRPLPPDCPVHRPGTDTSQRAGLRRGLSKPSASDRTTIPPVRPRPTVLYRTRRRSRHLCRRASPSATQRTFHPSYRRTRAFDDRQTAPPRPSPRANESRRSEKRALLHPTRFRSKAAHSRRRLRPPGGSGSVSNRAEKTNRSRPLRIIDGCRGPVRARILGRVL